ncbi:MAG TPA: antitoxin Xre/MbcA/ParS toxin-binding domain-containing protein [Gemmatimonadales bacterium]|nr:antitoxin Xre/MbcA/ParS toxin-binding domain-containing protein [Gemmatimonadales bacterium]
MQTTLTAINDPALRKRFSGSAVRAFLDLARVWKLSVAEQLELLGSSMTRQTLTKWGARSKASLSADELMRISFLLAIYEGLQRIWRNAPEEADKWIRRPRKEAPFEGATPLDYMRRGIPALERTRVYVDTIAGGPPSREG